MPSNYFNHARVDSIVHLRFQTSIIKTMILIKPCTNYGVRLYISHQSSYINYIIMFDSFEICIWINDDFLTLTLVKGGNHLIIWIIPMSIMLRTFPSTIIIIYLQNDDKISIYYIPNLSLVNRRLWVIIIYGV